METATTTQSAKLHALDDFTDRLLRSSARDAIAKIVVFGSVNAGTPRSHSDIDVLVLTTGLPQKINRAARRVVDRVFDRTGQWVEVHAQPVSAWLMPQSLFTLGALRGREVYSMEEAEIRKIEAQKYVGLAMTYRETAETLFTSGQLRVAADATHNAIELSLKAMLLLQGSSLPRSHREVINNFALAWKSDQRLPRGLTKRLHHSLDTRNQARYDPDAIITKAEVTAMLKLADNVLMLLKEETSAKDSPIEESTASQQSDSDCPASSCVIHGPACPSPVRHTR